jgi:small basic protein (TIGR04137 family)
MSMDRSLKSANSLTRHRNVLKRGERLDKLAEEEKWDESKSVFGLPKVAHRKMELAKVEKEEVPAEGAAVAGAVPAAGAAPAAGAPAAKGAAPAAAAKGVAAAPAKGAAPAKAAAPAKGKK